MAHLQKLDAYPLAPGCDFFTRSVRTPCIDTGVDVDETIPLGTRIYISEDTVGEYAAMFGWISPAEAEVLKKATLEAHERAEEAEAQLAELNAVKDSLLRAGFSLPPVPGPESEITEFPHHKGAGWWLLSDGQTIRGSRKDAEDAEADIAESGVAA